MAEVECHSGGGYAERPLAFHWQGQRLPVAAVVKRWREPFGPCFRVRTEDGRVFDLAYNEQSDAWRIDLP